MSKLIRTSLGAAGFLGVLGLTALISGPAAVAAPPPRITVSGGATSETVPVNTKVFLYGRNFRPHHTVYLDECSQTSWVTQLPPNPLVPCYGSKHLKTTSSGTFRLKVGVSQCSTPSGGPETCYIGVFHYPTDQGWLKPYVTFTVTFPS
jgi:hypothetical protein